MMKRAFDTLDLDNANIASVSDAISRRLVVTGAVCFFSLGLCFLAFVMNWTLSLSSSFSRAFLILSVAMAGLALVATLLQLGRQHRLETEISYLLERSSTLHATPVQ